MTLSQICKHTLPSGKLVSEHTPALGGDLSLSVATPGCSLQYWPTYSPWANWLVEKLGGFLSMAV